MDDDLTPIIRRRHDRIAHVYDWLDTYMEMMGFSQHRVRIMKRVRGKVLEVGVGTGSNIPYYPDAEEGRIDEIVAIDFSRRMLERAEEKKRKFDRPVTLREMDIQEMEFADDQFDTVLSTCVFCSVPDPIQGLLEIKRVLKPGGQLIMLEHVRSSISCLGSLMDILNFLSVKIWGGNINRDTLSNLREAGFEIELEDALFLDVLKFIEARKPPEKCAVRPEVGV